MNRNLKQSVWVLALGIAFTGLNTSSLTAGVPAQQDQGRGQDQDDHNRNQNRDRYNNNQYADSGYFQQGLRDGQHDRQYGGNRNDHQQPSNKNDRRAYQDGYKQGYSNTAYNQQNDRSRNANYFDQGLRDGQSDRQYGGNRSNHQQPINGNDLRSYQDGYRQGYQGFRNTDGRSN